MLCCAVHANSVFEMAADQDTPQALGAAGVGIERAVAQGRHKVGTR